MPWIIAVPQIANVYGLLAVSLLLIDTVAFLTPAAVGLKVTTKVVLDAFTTVVAGAVETVKSLAFAPEIETAPILKTPKPVLLIVNVLVILVEPKSVQFDVDGVRLPFVIA